MKMTKADYERQGRDAAQHDAKTGGSTPCLLTPGHWMHTAWMHGFNTEADRINKGKMKTPLNVIDTDNLAKMLVDKSPSPHQSARVQHTFKLAHDHNAEKRAPRRLRLFKAVGRMLERSGITQPIPLA